MSEPLDLIRSQMELIVKRMLEEVDAVDGDADLRAIALHYAHRNAGLRRPRLIWATAAAYGASATDDAVATIAAASELLHVFALVHDDGIDNEQSERSGPEVSATVRLLAGDLFAVTGYALLGEVVASNRLDPQILSDLRSIGVGTIAGQMADIRYLDGDVSFQRLYEIYDAKTGWYTVAGPLSTGARIAGFGEAEVDALRRVALPLGRAYQLRDDLIDLLAVITQSRIADRSRPRWELNLAVTLLASTGVWPNAETRPTEAPELWRRVCESDPDLVEQAVKSRIGDLVREAEIAAERLSIQPSARDAFIREVISILSLRELPPSGSKSTL